MDGENVRVNALHMRVGAMSAAEAQRFAVEVGEQLGEQLADLPIESLDRLDLRVVVSSGVGRDALVEQVVRAIVQGLARR